jgi:hypothetical protein
LSIEIQLSGFFFLFIIITNVASSIFGYKTFGELDANTKLQKINKDPRKFKIGVVLILIEHFSIISLAVTLFFAIGFFNLILGIVWCIFRIGEALIQIYDKKNYWRLLDLGIKYSITTGIEKDALIDSSRAILKTRESRFAIAQILFSMGTLAYSILFVVYMVVPIIIGWFGIIVSILYGLGDGIYHIKPSFKILWNIGGLLILLFEIILGGWLLFFSPI